MVQSLRLHSPNAGGPGSIPGWGTRSHTATKDPVCLNYRFRMPQWRSKILHAATKIQHNQINKEIKIDIKRHEVLLLSHQVVSNSLWPHELQHTRLCCPLPSPVLCSNSCPLSQWCHPTLPSVAPFILPSESFPVNWLFVSGGQSFGASASVLPMSIQCWYQINQS